MFYNKHQTNGNIQSDIVLDKKFNEYGQMDHFMEISVIPDPEKEVVRERKWTTLHSQAMELFPIRIPVEAFVFFSLPFL